MNLKNPVFFKLFPKITAIFILASFAPQALSQLGDRASFAQTRFKLGSANQSLSKLFDGDLISFKDEESKKAFNRILRDLSVVERDLADLDRVYGSGEKFDFLISDLEILMESMDPFIELRGGYFYVRRHNVLMVVPQNGRSENFLQREGIWSELPARNEKDQIFIEGDDSKWKIFTQLARSFERHYRELRTLSKDQANEAKLKKFSGAILAIERWADGKSKIFKDQAQYPTGERVILYDR